MGAARPVVREGVILLNDVHNFSMAFAEMMEGYEFLQEMYEKLGDLVVEKGGEIVKYLGDSMLCLFPAGAEAAAVDCGKAMRKRFAAMVARSALPPSIVLEVGISSGRLVVGECGHATLRQKDVFGMAVVEAAQIGHYRGVAITERVYDRVRKHCETRRLPDERVKWQTRPLKAWAVVE